MKTITKTSYHNMYHRHTELYSLKFYKYHFYPWHTKSEFILEQDLSSFKVRLHKVFQLEL